MTRRQFHRGSDGKSPLDSLLNELSEFGPTYPGRVNAEPLPEFTIVITLKKEHLGGGPGDSNIYIAATNLPELLKNSKAKPKVYLHLGFFNLPKLKQLEILHWCVVSQLTKRITDPEKALQDAQMFVKFYCAGKADDK